MLPAVAFAFDIGHGLAFLNVFAVRAALGSKVKGLGLR